MFLLHHCVSSRSRRSPLRTTTQPTWRCVCWGGTPSRRPPPSGARLWETCPWWTTPTLRGAPRTTTPFTERRWAAPVLTLNLAFQSLLQFNYKNIRLQTRVQVNAKLLKIKTWTFHSTWRSVFSVYHLISLLYRKTSFPLSSNFIPLISNLNIAWKSFWHHVIINDLKGKSFYLKRHKPVVFLIIWPIFISHQTFTAGRIWDGHTWYLVFHSTCF